MTTVLALVLAASLAAGQADGESASPVLGPGQPGYVLKRTREMIELARSHDPDRRANLFLGFARERLREREALGRQGGASGLGESYDRLVSRGAAGSIECGAAEGRDMAPAVARLDEATRRDHDAWARVVEAEAPEDRLHDLGAVRASADGLSRARSSQSTGQTFFAEVRAKEEALERERERQKKALPPPPPPPPAAPPSARKADPKPATLPAEPGEAPRRPDVPENPPAAPEKKDPDKDPATGKEAPPATGDSDARSRDHHHMPHRPHR